MIETGRDALRVREYHRTSRRNSDGSVVEERNENPTCKDYLLQVKKSFRSRGAAFWCCLVLGLLVLAILITFMIIYFGLWRGTPTVRIIGVVPPTKDFTNQAQVDLGDMSQGRSPKLIINVKLMVGIYNPNKMNLAFDNIVIRAYHPLVPTLQIATATIDQLTLPKESDTEIEVPLKLDYLFSDDPNSLIPKDLIASCTIPDGAENPEKQLQLIITVDALLHITNVIRPAIPHISDSPTFDCPFKGSPLVEISSQKYDMRRVDWSSLMRGRLGFI